MTRGQGQSPALEACAHANFGVTSPCEEADALEREAALNTLRASTKNFSTPPRRLEALRVRTKTSAALKPSEIEKGATSGGGWELRFQAVPPSSVFLRPTAHGTGCLGFPSRKSAPRPEPRSALEPPGLAPFRRLFRFSASVDRQMTPPSHGPLFRAYALSRPSLADRLSGTPAAALRPKASRRAGLREGRARVEHCAA